MAQPRGVSGEPKVDAPDAGTLALVIWAWEATIVEWGACETVSLIETGWLIAAAPLAVVLIRVATLASGFAEPVGSN